MARYSGPKHRLCRREGMRLCNAKKCPLDRKGAQAPGQHGKKFSGRISDYGVQLREKQKVKRLYGLLEKQFRRNFDTARKDEANTGIKLLQLLESRLDNVVFRAHLAPTRRFARQIVSHGHVLVNGKKLDIPSSSVKPGQVVSLSPQMAKNSQVVATLEAKETLPTWLSRKATTAKVERLPERGDIDANINEQLIIEFYSR